MTPEMFLLLQFMGCSALFLSAAFFAKHALRLGETLATKQLLAEKKKNEELLRRFQKRLSALEGHATQSHIQAKIAQKYSQVAHTAAIEAQTRVGALEKSTHSVQFMPIEKLMERNGTVNQEVDRILNPSQENFDWFDDGINDD